MDVYAVVGKDAVDGVEEGVYHYDPIGHRVACILTQDVRKDVARASLEQMWMAHAPVIIVITSEYSRITVKYRERGIAYAIMEAGHIAQNVFLQSVALGLSAGIVGAFREEKIIKYMGLPRQHIPLIIMPIGYEDLKDMSDKQ
jgi:SagB-type dehydrogenase family enzyme